MPGFPILDLECDPPKPQRAWAAWLVGIATGAAVLSWPGSIDPVSWFPVLILSIALHEVGHLVAARLVGMQPGAIVVCGLVIFRSGAGWRFRFDWRRLLSGAALPLPKKGEFDPVRYAWMVAGGPIASLLLVGASWTAWKLTGERVGWISSFLWVNLILLPGTLIPFSLGAIKSDAARLWMLFRHPDQSRQWMALAQVMAQDTQCVQPRDWDAELFDQMMRYGSETGDQAYAQLLAFHRRVDAGDNDAALDHLEKALAASGSCGRMIRHACFSEAACSSAVLRSNPAAARAWRDRAAKLRRPISRHNLDAAIAQSEGRWEDAAKSWDATLAFVAARKFDSGTVRSATRRIAEYRDRCLEAAQSQARAAGV